MKEKVLISGGNGDIHYLKEGEGLLDATFSLCGERTDAIDTTRVRDKHTVSCPKCLGLNGEETVGKIELTKDPYFEAWRRSKNITEGKGEIYICPKCSGSREDNEAIPSPMIGGGDYRPPCSLCDGKGYIIHKEGVKR